jgi:hypothetical protein
MNESRLPLPWNAEECACGAKLVSCHGCCESRCLKCDPYSEYERLNRCCVTTNGERSHPGTSGREALGCLSGAPRPT